MKIREADRRCVGRIQEYPGAVGWPEFEYKCPDCGRWHPGGDVTQVHNDGTESVLCAKCAKLIDNLFEEYSQLAGGGEASRGRQPPDASP